MGKAPLVYLGSISGEYEMIDNVFEIYFISNLGLATSKVHKQSVKRLKNKVNDGLL